MELSMPLLVLLVLTLAGLHGQTGPVSSDTSQWPRYQNEALGVSFAYPTELRPVVTPAEKLRGIEGWLSQVLLVANAPSDAEKHTLLAVSVYVCDDPSLNPRVPCFDEKTYRQICDRFEKFPLGDATAIQCVTYGRGACHWSAVVLRAKGRVEISAPEAERALQPETNTRAACAGAVVTIRTQPLLRQVLASFRF